MAIGNKEKKEETSIFFMNSAGRQCTGIYF